MTPLFISAANVKNLGVLEDNVDVKLINNTTIMVQDMDLQYLLGTDLYNEIADQINNNTLTALNTTLLNEYITNYLVCAVTADIAVTMNYRYANKAIITANSDNQQPVSSPELELIRAKWQGKADFYSKRMTQYLKQERANYPLFFNNQDESDIQSHDGKYKSGFWLGKPRRKDNRNNKWPYCLND